MNKTICRIAISLVFVMALPVLLFAQALPGPAQEGWFVVIGTNTFAIHDGTFDRSQACLAMVLPAAELKELPMEKARIPVRKFGPYSSAQAATSALMNAGWVRNGDVGWIASTGCDVDEDFVRRKIEEDRQQAEKQQRQRMEAEPHQEAVNAASIEAVRNKIRPCWSSFGGYDGVIVSLVIKMNRDGTPASAEVQDVGRYNKQGAYRAAADSAWRAVMNPRCQPWPLDPATYDRWKTINMTFNPDLLSPMAKGTVKH
jgi:hypothetical protein